MTEMMVEPDIEVDDLPSFGETIPCEFLFREPSGRKIECPFEGKHRIRLACLNMPCNNAGILWGCDEHLQMLAQSEISCRMCGAYGLFKWELI